MLGPGFNPDEPQMIAGAITLERFPVYWEYVDGTTHGPLANVPLLIGNALGLPLDYAGARFVAGVLMIVGEASPMRAFHRERYLADF